MKSIERMKLIRELMVLNTGLGDAPARERLKKIGRILAIVKMLGEEIGKARPVAEVGDKKPAKSKKSGSAATESVNPDWEKDREILQSIIDGKHPDMRRPALYDTFTAISKRQKGNPECPALFEQAVFAWQAVAYEMTDKIVA